MRRVVRLPIAWGALVGLMAAVPAFGFGVLDKPDTSLFLAMKDKPLRAHHAVCLSGARLVGDKITKDGKYTIHDHDKFSVSVDVRNRKTAGVLVRHVDRGPIAVTKYRTTQPMGKVPAGGVYFAPLGLAQDTYLKAEWIGYAYVDDHGEEVIYWFPHDMIMDGDTGAIEYVSSVE